MALMLICCDFLITPCVTVIEDIEHGTLADTVNRKNPQQLKCIRQMAISI